jgi:ATP-binding cassette subfamily B protein
MTRSDDTFIPLAERVHFARSLKASLFISIHADYLPHSEGSAQGATVYTLSDKASDAEAARLAEAEQFIDALPQGFDTPVGERGQKLSGGQRQRISIARAVLKDAPILILDEATSSVDNETEQAIQRSLEYVALGRTTIVIAHRLTTIQNADQIFTLEHGRIVDQRLRAPRAAQ